MTLSMQTFREFLADQFQQRQNRNPRFSLRAFASTVGLSPAQLSQVLSGKRIVTPQTIHTVSEKLGISPSEKREFLKRELIDTPDVRRKQLLSEDQFALIADWYHLAILSLGHLSKAQKDPVWVSRKLGISIRQATEALERLERLDLLEPGSRLKQKGSLLSVTSDVPSAAIRKFHLQVLQLADEKLGTVPVDQRDYSAVTFNLPRKNFEKARHLIEKFQDDLTELLSSSDESETYMLSCQLFPLSLQKSKGEHS